MKKFITSLCAFFVCTSVWANTQTFSMIKPTAVKEHHIGGIINQIEEAKFSVAGLKMKQLSKEQAQEFYAEHKGKPFYEELVTMMSSGPVVLMVIDSSNDNTVQALRDIIGSTDPKKAAAGTIRANFGKSVTENAIHASDSPESAAREIAFFFTKDELYTK